MSVKRVTRLSAPGYIRVKGQDCERPLICLDHMQSVELASQMCAKSSHSFDRHGRKSNSLYDHYRNKGVREELDKITTI